MIYEFRCRECGNRAESQTNQPIPCSSCGGVLRRDYSSVRIGAVSFTPHFNHAVGAHVSSNREFNDLLKARSDENSARTGLDTSYTRVDPGDMPMPTTGTEIFETRDKLMRDKNIKPADLA